MPINIVLVEPEIPQNTGNIARTCASIGADLHLVRPFGFKISDRTLKRAGLDYWHLVKIHYHDSYTEILKKADSEGANCYFFTTKAKKKYTEIHFRDGDYLFFGRESRGLPEYLVFSEYENALRIPMRDEFRSLNLSNSVAIVAYEAMRQLGFEGLE
ncbi:MAG: tRNA (uridine(34)/cytosine(34)/5-carboxymethylaminomethyluridine(34)-2'-O)-methyltransferase TrmL [Clostridia bacterium]|nr:tRNA (uridine(34)/cytosine(34)/5-carboxymethylaminomethyluridine(34)-2'-O)-methyltransferase TrmL [Clostridia bacterium]